MAKVIFVHLRNPASKDQRHDPFWEFGSFGLTKCHKKNLMNPRKYRDLEGARLAFAQGGKGEMRLVLLRPPVRVHCHKGGIEVTWQPAEMPLTFESAPILMRNQGRHSDFSLLEQSLRSVGRETPVAKFSVSFRSRRTPVDDDLARQVADIYHTHRRSPLATIAESYAYARPRPPVPILTLRERRQEYRTLRKKARESCKHCTHTKGSCPGT
jgi:hypothetical protein